MFEEPPGDASTLIYIAKAAAFEEISRCVGVLWVSPSVWRESVDAGLRVGAPEVERITDAEARGLVKRLDLSRSVEARALKIAADYGLGRGESEVLAIGEDLREGVVIDEGRGTRVANALGIRSTSTLFLPVIGARRSKLGVEEAVSLLRRLASPAGASAAAVFAIEQAIRR
jgi:predicted nucleic acid-binding protein